MIAKLKKVLVKKLQGILKGKRLPQTYMCINLWCPDGLRESLGFDLPEQIDGFITFMNTWSKKKEYTIELYKYDEARAILELLGTEDESKT